MEETDILLNRSRHRLLRDLYNTYSLGQFGLVKRDINLRIPIYVSSLLEMESISGEEGKNFLNNILSKIKPIKEELCI